MLREESWLKELNKAKENLENRSNLDTNDKLTFEKLSLSHQNLVKKQNVFFRYSLYILLNISEDLKLEFKIFHKGIVSILGKLLERNNQELLLIVVLFLKKLSVFIENKIQMKELCIYKSLSPLLYLDNELLFCNTLKLIYNLMIDHDIRIYFVRSGIFPNLVSFFLKDRYSSVLVSIFFLISCENKFILLFKNDQIINVLLEKIFQNVDYKIILYKLLANLAINENLAEIMITNNNFTEIIRLALLENDIHLLRLCRNISCHPVDVIKVHFFPFIPNFIQLIRQNVDNDGLHLIEYFAILTNLSANNSANKIDWLNIFQQNTLYEFLLNYLKNNALNDKKSINNKHLAVVNHLLLFIGTAVTHQSELSFYLIENNFIDHLLQLINCKRTIFFNNIFNDHFICFFLSYHLVNQENDDIVSNAVYCLYTTAREAKDKRNEICQDTSMINCQMIFIK